METEMNPCLIKKNPETELLLPADFRIVHDPINLRRTADSASMVFNNIERANRV